MAKINYQIGEGNFSLVMKRIASILLVEFANQITLGNTFLPDEVCYDTSSAASEGDIPFVAVNWMKLDSTIDARNSSQNENVYFIDVKAVGYDNVRKIIAVIRTILKDQQYVILDFPYGTVSDVNIISAGIDLEERNRGSQDTINGGVQIKCNVLETNPPMEGIEIQETDYELQINDSDKILKLTNIL